jgi:hypothetical protein
MRRWWRQNCLIGLVGGSDDTALSELQDRTSLGVPLLDWLLDSDGRDNPGIRLHF